MVKYVEYGDFQLWCLLDRGLVFLSCCCKLSVLYVRVWRAGNQLRTLYVAVLFWAMGGGWWVDIAAEIPWIRLLLISKWKRPWEIGQNHLLRRSTTSAGPLSCLENMCLFSIARSLQIFMIMWSRWRTTPPRWRLYSSDLISRRAYCCCSRFVLIPELPPLSVGLAGITSMRR